MCMRYINPNSRRGIVNKLADYILNQIDKSQTTRLQVTDFKTFYVVNGNTNSDKVLDLSIIKESFYNENKFIRLVHLSLQFFIWECKLKHVLPTGDFILGETIEMLDIACSLSLDLESDKNNYDCNLSRVWDTIRARIW